MIKDSEERAVDKIRIIQGDTNTQLAKLDKLDHFPSASGLLWSGLSMVLLTVGLILGVLTYAGDRFDGGIGLGTAIGDKFSENTIAIAENSRRDAETRKTVDSLIARIDAFIERLESKPATSPETK